MIERVLRDQDISGTTLYVTLEPCTKRNLPKSPCANRVASARIKRVVIGMLDPNPDIQGHGVNYLLAHHVKVDFFDVDLNHKIVAANQEFSEQFRQEKTEVTKPEERDGVSEKEKELVPTTTVDDFSEEVIGRYLKARKERIKVPSAELWRLLSASGFLVYDEKRKVFVPTVAGLLLFGRRPEDALVQSKVKLEIHKGTKVKAEDIGGPLLEIPGKIQTLIKEYGPTYTVIKGFNREKEPEYPWEASLSHYCGFKGTT